MANLLESIENTVFLLIFMRIAVILGVVMIVARLGFMVVGCLPLHPGIKDLVVIGKKRIIRYKNLLRSGR